MLHQTRRAIVVRPGRGANDRPRQLRLPAGSFISNGDATPERLNEIAQASSMEVVGPVPEGYLETPRRPDREVTNAR